MKRTHIICSPDDQMLPDPDYGLFVEAVDLGSLSAAGRSIGLSPGMVSKRIARLEQRLGAQLLHRTTRKLSLTSAGQQFVEDVREILAAIEAAEARLAVRQGLPVGPLRVSAPTSFGRLHLVPYLRQFLDSSPGIQLELDLTDDFVSFPSQTIDLAIRITSEKDPALVQVQLAESKRFLCAAPGYLGCHGVPQSISDLGGHRLLAASGQTPWRLSGPEGKLDVEVNSYVRTNSSEVVRELALAGVGVALRSMWDISSELASGRLVQVLPSHQGSSDVRIWAVHLRSPYVPASVVTFIDFLKQLNSPPPWEKARTQ